MSLSHCAHQLRHKRRLLRGESLGVTQQLPSVLETGSSGDRTPEEKSRLDEPLGAQTKEEGRGALEEPSDLTSRREKE